MCISTSGRICFDDPGFDHLSWEYHCRLELQSERGRYRDVTSIGDTAQKGYPEADVEASQKETCIA